jgi:hypothetical protein
LRLDNQPRFTSGVSVSAVAEPPPPAPPISQFLPLVDPPRAACGSAGLSPGVRPWQSKPSSPEARGACLFRPLPHARRCQPAGAKGRILMCPTGGRSPAICDLFPIPAEPAIVRLNSYFGTGFAPRPGSVNHLELLEVVPGASRQFPPDKAGCTGSAGALAGLCNSIATRRRGRRRSQCGGYCRDALGGPLPQGGAVPSLRNHPELPCPVRFT